MRWYSLEADSKKEEVQRYLTGVVDVRGVLSGLEFTKESGSKGLWYFTNRVGYLDIYQQVRVLSTDYQFKDVTFTLKVEDSNKELIIVEVINGRAQLLEDTIHITG